MNVKNNKSKQNSKSKIANAFMQLIQNKDIKNITVTEICVHANVNRSTFYASYLDIYDLIEKIGNKAFKDFKELHKNDTDSEYLIKLLHYIKENQLFYKSYSKLRTDNYLDNTFFESLNNNSNNSNYLSEIYHIYHRAGVSKVINHWLQNDCNTTPDELYFIIKKIKTDL